MGERDARPFADEQGDAKGAIAIYRDVTEAGMPSGAA
jgi:hypothetical protein